MSGDLERVENIKKDLEETNPDKDFNVEEQLYDHMLSLLSQAEKELKKSN